MARIVRGAIVRLAALALAACSIGGPHAPAPVEQRSAGAERLDPRGPAGAATPAPAAAAAPPAAPSDVPPRDTVTRMRARWTAATYAELPGWADDRAAEVWPAFVAGCQRPAPGWSEVCARALLDPPLGDDAVRRWFALHLQPWRVEAPDGAAEGLITGYFEPTLEAVRTPRGAFRVPVYAPPPELATRRPYYTRTQLETLPQAMAALRGLEIAWLEDPLDVLLLHVQGSGRLRLVDGDARPVRVAFAAHNDQPYRSVGRWLVEQGELGADAVSWPAIKAWAQRHPRRVPELLRVNPRFVFFREEPLPDPEVGPRGAAGVPLTPRRSIAVDPAAVPLGAVVWVDTTEPLSAQRLRRLVMAQDTGGAITGAVRADFFWGWDKDAEAQAGRMKQPLRMWVLWPRGAAPTLP